MAPVPVYMTGMREDGSSYLTRSWGEVLTLRNTDGSVRNVQIELVQVYIHGVPHGQATDRAYRRMAATRRNDQRRRDQAQNERQDAGLRDILRSARTVVDEWGPPGRREGRQESANRAGDRRRRRESEESPRRMVRRRLEEAEDEANAREEEERRHRATASDGRDVRLHWEETGDGSPNVRAWDEGPSSQGRRDDVWEGEVDAPEGGAQGE